MLRTYLICILLAFSAALAHAQVSGLITDTTGEPLAGAAVQIFSLNDTLTTLTSAAGEFQLSPKQTGPQSLRVTYLGMQPLTRSFRYNNAVVDLGQLIVQTSANILAEAQVLGVRAKPGDPFAFVNIDAEKLAKANIAQDVPMLLRRTPGAVVTSDAGNGVGYTGIRIRGADATRINVTINGVPLNDAESQGVFWVNMPDFISSTNSIQVQRGVGQSTYGTGAFGANINMLTNTPNQLPRIAAELAGGSFNTGRAMLSGSTGVLSNGFSAEARASYITSDGFVDRASSQLGSVYLGTSYSPNDKQQLQVIGWTGEERTYQSWFGIPRSFAESDQLRTFNPAGEISDGVYYDDQTDNYRQTHGQILYSHHLKPKTLLQLTGHYTRGFGYYEEYRQNRDVEEYNLVPAFKPGSSTDLVRRLYLDNHFFGAIATVSNELSNQLDLTVSAGINKYTGDHYGTTIAVFGEDLPSPEALQLPQRFYDNTADKLSTNTFAKLNYRPTAGIALYADMQLRSISYQLEGPDRNGNTLDGDYDLLFFNPKLGFAAYVSDRFSTYGSAAVGQREPNRNDFQAAINTEPPSAETLYDFELGFRTKPTHSGQYTVDINAYYMLYRDQLVPTGALNDVGEYVRVNVDESYRYGTELAAAVKLAKDYSVEGNVALSQSRIQGFDEFLDNWATGEQDVVRRRNTQLAFSPQVIANLGFIWSPKFGSGHLDVELWGNAVSKQYLDNSESEVASLPAYTRFDLESKYTWTTQRGRALTASVQVQNLVGNNPITNGYSYRYNSPGFDPRPDDPYTALEAGDTYVLTGYYPQAGTQILAGLRIELTKANSYK